MNEMIKHLVLLFISIWGCSNCNAQIVVNPVFERCDIPNFRIQKVTITSDTTFVYCIYYAEKNSWANISKETYIEEFGNGKRCKVLKTSGLPFGPEKRYFTHNDTIQVLLFFPHIETNKFNLIEEENSKSFNIYGIDLNQSFANSYTSGDIASFFHLSQIEKENENWQSATDYYLKQLEAVKFIEGLQSYPVACAMYNLTLNYFNTKDYEKMIECGNKAIDILRKLPQDSICLDVLSKAYGTVSAAYFLTNQTEKGNYYEERSLALRRNGSGIGNVSYEEYLRHMAHGYYYEDNYPKALLYQREFVDYIERKYKEDSLTWGCAYVVALSELSEFYQRMDKVEEAIISSNKALDLINSGICEDSIWIKDMVRINMGGALATKGDVDEAINILKDISHNTNNKRISINSKMLLADIFMGCKQDTAYAINEFESVLRIIEEQKVKVKDGHCYNTEYAEILEKLYRANKEKDPPKALMYLKKAIQHEKEWNGEKSVAYGNTCLNYLNDIYILYNSLSGSKSEKDSLFSYLQQSSEILKRHLCNSIYNMSKDERVSYWHRYDYIYTWLIPTVCSMMDGTDEANSLAYDATLFYKGILLSSEKEIKDVIQSSNDNTLIGIYKEYVNNLSLLEEQYNFKSYQVNIDSLKRVIKNQEYLLSKEVTRFNKWNKGTNFSWEEVKNNLNEDDIAIEIVSYPNIDGSTIFYDAYVVESESTVPTIIFMFEENDLNNCFLNDSIDYKKLYMLTWGNKYLNDAIKDKKNIYFSASGLLHTIGIEYLPFPDGQYICDKHNIYRLSSTRELCYNISPIKTESACLYGGLDYNLVKTNKMDIAIENGDDKISYRVSRAINDSIVARGDFEPLIGSQQEIEQIKHEIVRKKIQCNVFADSEGTEESFKNLSGSHINIIHLSTHGMYVPYENYENKRNNNFRFMISDDSSYIDEEDQSLSRSFLVMSGGNMLIHRDSIPNGEDDGILTALEISHLDFDCLDLVVLSACQTALGDIDSDGVYGLQRSFKKAGANTILMSVDKVDDEATRILMVDFYKNLLAGKCKRQSLKDAQKHLRQVDNGKYDDPKYWASFIMLDGLN